MPPQPSSLENALVVSVPRPAHARIGNSRMYALLNAGHLRSVWLGPHGRRIGRDIKRLAQDGVPDSPASSEASNSLSASRKAGGLTPGLCHN